MGALLVALGLVVAACGGGDDEGGDTSTGGGGTTEAKKVGLVYDIGGRGDKSFNDSAFAGLEAARQEQGDKLEAKDVEPNPDGSNRKELLDGLADEGYGLIFGVGFLFSEDIAKSATESPDTQFAVIDGFDKSCTEPDKNLPASASRRSRARSWSGRRPPSRPSPTPSASSAARWATSSRSSRPATRRA
jgi:basic membrane lipoprotein Med (substrate-binding protein (PBP1-ABC) superfamily)